jgi:hypothetical protein
MNQHMRWLTGHFPPRRPRPHPAGAAACAVAPALSATLAVALAIGGGARTVCAQSDPPRPTSEPDAAARPGDAEPAPDDRYLIRVGVEGAPAGAGRLLLFFVPDSARWSGVDPADAPFFDRLQPVASVAVGEVAAGGTITFDEASATTFGGPLAELRGAWRVQAVLDTDFTARGHLGPGNLVSEPTRIEFDPTRADEVRLELTRRIEAVAPERGEAERGAAGGDAPKPNPDASPNPNLLWIHRRSALLSKHFGRDFDLRAGVVLPFGYHDLDFPRRMWPTIYVIGGFGATHLAAAESAAALSAPEARAAIPQAVWVFLDPETAWGHHGFCDSETNGPVGRALVEEFVPYLEERFRLIAKPEARIVTGHSSGGWTALHLALTYDGTFGACFASAPDPVDFSAFQRTDLYRDASLFLSGDGDATPSYRAPLGPGEDRVLMTVRDEIATEHALDPNGRSGQQWAAWDAMWSPYDAARGAPRRLCDPVTGAIDPVTVEHWSHADIARRFERDPARIAGIFATRIRLLCGTRDSFYLNEAVARLQSKLEAWRAQARARGEAVPEGPGSIELLEGLTHDTLHPAAQLRFHRGMVEHLRAHGLGEAPPRPSAENPARK